VEREDIVTPIKAFIEKHPVLTYYALVFAISWGGILMLVAPGGIPGEPEDVARLFPFTLAALFAGPSVAGVVMTALVSGRAGFRELLARLGRWRVGAAWWAAALLIGPVLVAAVLFARASSGLAGGASLTGFIASFLAFYFVALPAYRVLMVWVYDHTASLLVAMVMHAVLSASTIVLQPLSAHGQFTWNVLLGAALWAVVAVVTKVRRGELPRRPVQRAVGHVS